MKKWTFAAVIALTMAATGGCGLWQGMEQWKCDHLGWCHNGITPSNQPQVPVVCPPVAGGCPTCAPPAFRSPAP